MSRRSYYIKNKEKILKKNKEWSTKNKERVLKKNKEWYEENKNYVKRYRQYRRSRRMHWLWKYKVAKGCQVCGFNNFAGALDFDHIDSKNKLYDPGRIIGCNLKKLFLELRKCQILCANCHREKSQSQKSFV